MMEASSFGFSFKFQFLAARGSRRKNRMASYTVAEISSRLFFSKRNQRDAYTYARRVFFPAAPENKRRAGQIFGVGRRGRPLVASCVALVRRHVIIPG